MINRLDDMYISEQLVLKELEADSDEEVLNQMADLMIAQDVVEKSFKEAVKEREKVFATGLALEYMGVAIPHTDSEHVKIQSLAIGRLKRPVKFNVMGGEQTDFVDVNLVIMLAIKDPHKQIEFLQALVELIQNRQQMEKLLKLDDEKSIIQLFSEMMK